VNAARSDHDAGHRLERNDFTIGFEMAFAFKHDVDLCHLLMVVSLAVRVDVREMYGCEGVPGFFEGAPCLTARTGSGWNFIELGDGVAWLGHGFGCVERAVFFAMPDTSLPAPCNKLPAVRVLNDNRMKAFFFSVFCWACVVIAADTPADSGLTIPESAQRTKVVMAQVAQKLPRHDLPDGYTLELAAATPLVTHPIMGCLDDRGRLFVGDAVGVNWNKLQLEKNPPNRILMLEDTDGNGIYDKSTIFADNMTFPQGACWLKGSLYVGSPPSLWKLTDTDNDGVADQREEIVTGFDYTGNAADIHGPFFNNSNGRLYWCHGRKGHRVTQKDGTMVDESMACGIWSCLPDGKDVQWHSLGCGDNPVEVDFTPEGDVIGVQNLYYSQPRGDTIIQWLYGGVYERADQLKAIEHLPRTLETMPVMHNFGHVAVSGCCFWRGFGGNALQFMVTHFNTGRLVRMELTPQGSTYRAVENPFLKLHDPDIHLTDVMEDPRDGSLLLFDTGGWFRIGCPSSLMAKSDILGAIYRIRPAKPIKLAALGPVQPKSAKALVADLKSKSTMLQRRALEALAQNLPDEAASEHEAIAKALRQLLRADLDPTLEHSVIQMAQQTGVVSLDDLKKESHPKALRRMLVGFVPDDASSMNLSLGVAAKHLDAKDAALARVALSLVTGHQDADEWITPQLMKWLETGTLTAERQKALEGYGAALMSQPQTQQLITRLLSKPATESIALRLLASQTSGVVNEAWLAPLDQKLAAAPTPLVLDAIQKLRSPHFDPALLKLASDNKQPQSIRLKAMDAVRSMQLTGETLAMVKRVIADPASSAAAKIQAAGMLVAAPMTKEQIVEVVPLFASLGPVELKTLLPLLKKHRDADLARRMATEIAKNPAIASQQESHYRTALADLPVDIFETIIHPAYEKATKALEVKKRQLTVLADKAATMGNATSGKAHFAAGKGTCIACHKIGDMGRAIGPDLSKIGAIRTERDLLESILFPSNTLARDYEAHIIETRDGVQTMGVIRSHTAEGLLVVDMAGQEKTLPHAAIISDTSLTTSLMPMGLDQTLPEGELLDLVAYLRSLK
jgi:putative membrane-bound dehydrogenase-like protein